MSRTVRALYESESKNLKEKVVKASVVWICLSMLTVAIGLRLGLFRNEAAWDLVQVLCIIAMAVELAVFLYKLAKDLRFLFANRVYVITGTVQSKTDESIGNRERFILRVSDLDFKVSINDHNKFEEGELVEVSYFNTEYVLGISKSHCANNSC